VSPRLGRLPQPGSEWLKRAADDMSARAKNAPFAFIFFEKRKAFTMEPSETVKVIEIQNLATTEKVYK